MLKLFNEVSQVAETVSELMDTLKKFVHRPGNEELDMSENIMTRVEDLLLVVIGLSQSESITTSMVLVLQYARTHTNRSYVLLLKKFFEQMRIDKHDGEGPQPISKSEIKSSLKGIKKQAEKEKKSVTMEEIVTNFKEMDNKQRLTTLRNTDLAEFTRHAINALIVVGLCPQKAETVLGSTLYDFCSVKMTPKDNKMDFLESVFHCIDWVVNSLKPAIKNGDWSLLVGKDELLELNSNYTKSLDAVGLMMVGKMNKVKEKYKLTTENDILHLVEETAMAHSVFLASMNKKSKGIHYELATKRVITLNKLVLDIYATIKETPIRVKPFGVLVYGNSGVSKSTLVPILNQQICFVNEFRCDKDSVVYMNGEDAYQSEYRTHHVTFVFDDMSNSKPERTVDNPLMKLIQFLNNMHINALSPEADKKGKMQVLPKVGFVTTNKKDLNAGYYSVSPVSILRRFEYTITAKLRPSAINPVTGMPYVHFATQACPDMWLLDVTHIKIVRMGGEIPDAMTEVTDLKGASIFQVNEFLKKKAVAHFAVQNKLVTTSTRIYSEKKCKEHGYLASECPICEGTFLPEGIENNSVENDESAAFIDLSNVEKQANIIPKVRGAFNRFKASYVTPEFDLEGVVTETLGVPDEIVGDGTGERTTLSPRERAMELVSYVKDEFQRHTEEVDLTTVAGILALMSAIFLVGRKVYKAVQPAWKRNFALEPYSEKEQDNMWKRPVITEMKFVEASKTCTYEQFEGKLYKNMARFGFHSPKGIINVLGIPVGGSDWLVPHHALPPEGEEWYVDVSMERDHGAVGYKKFHEYVNARNWSQVIVDSEQHTKTDLAVLRLSNTGSVKDFGIFVQEEAIRPTVKQQANVKLFYRDKQLKELKWPASAVLMEAPDYDIGFSQQGYAYILPNTFDGLCGSPLVTNGKNPMIVGLHVAGDGANAFAAMITQESLKQAKNRIQKWNAHGSAPLEDEEYGVRYNVGPIIHPKNPINFLSPEKEHHVTIYGQSTIPQVRFSSKVETSPISHAVTKVMGEPRAHTRPPTFAEYMHYNRDLDVMTEKKIPPKSSIMRRALKDMCDGFDEFFEGHPDFAKAVGKLTYEQAINGIDGAAGIDKLNFQASVSLPKRGKKSKYIKLVESDEHEVAYDFDEDVLDVRSRVEAMEKKLLTGVRINTLFAMCLKDEALTFAKYDNHKVRTYSAAQVAFIILVRMYFLPLMAARRRYPLHFESAVGTNAAGKDWRCFHESLRDPTRIFNGDFKHFDKGMEVQFSTGAFEYYEHVFKRCKMTQDFLMICRGIGTEVCYPVYEIKSLFLEVVGSNPSGQPLTVEVNNDANRLYMRYAYYTMHPEDVPLFHEKVDLLCYGDDNIGSVDESEKLFNHSSIAEVMKSIGVGYTMSDKESASVPFINIEQADLLKRKFVKHDTIGSVVGPIEEASILKSLHTWRTDSPLCEGEYMAGVLRQALDEYFLHGREMYEMRRPQIERIVQEHVCNPPISDFFFPPSFEDLVERYEKTSSVMEDFSQGVPTYRTKGLVKQSFLDPYPPLDSELRLEVPEELPICNPYVDHPTCMDQYCNWNSNVPDVIVAFVTGISFAVMAFNSWMYRMKFVPKIDLRIFFLIFPLLGSLPILICYMVIGYAVGKYFEWGLSIVEYGWNDFKVTKRQKRIVRCPVRNWKFSSLVCRHVDTPRKARNREKAEELRLLAYKAKMNFVRKMNMATWKKAKLEKQAEVLPYFEELEQQIQNDRIRRRMVQIDRELVCDELSMLAANVGQPIKVYCGSQILGISMEQKLLERQATERMCMYITRAWLVLKMHNTPLRDLFTGDVLYRILSGASPTFIAVHPGEFQMDGGFRSQAAKFRGEEDVASFPL
jgi:hypothetical protein